MFTNDGRSWPDRPAVEGTIFNSGGIGLKGPEALLPPTADVLQLKLPLDEVEEITWRTYEGQLTEKQEKTREKVLKRLEKDLARKGNHLQMYAFLMVTPLILDCSYEKRDRCYIRAKDISQGGLTQGQQTQIARNEQRISQLVEELENLEENLNESIHESLGARAGRTSRGKKKEHEEELSSEEDEFYDRTKKPSKRKTGENQSTETADSLLDKKDAIVREMEDEKIIS
ncbi:hypothetical protein RND71_032725 [Anisodus tanguticus]|uniref:Uncharacterized protein n=1 Tax=Anisodus tanguticus TaxID=243964 RepID=A0AAE1R7V6_9SOLA|nr:hypothetical protein RND71_032725 [Anisodus tanguticus]